MTHFYDQMYLCRGSKLCNFKSEKVKKGKQCLKKAEERREGEMKSEGSVWYLMWWMW